MDLEQEIFQDEPDIPEEFRNLSAEDLQTRSRLLDNEIRVLRDESTRLSLEASGLKERIKENAEKVPMTQFGNPRIYRPDSESFPARVLSPNLDIVAEYTSLQIKLNNTLPYLVSNIVEVLEV